MSSDIARLQRREIPAQKPAWAGNGEGSEAGEGKMATASDYSVRLDRVGAVSGLNLGAPSTGGSRTIQAHVTTNGGRRVEIRLGQQVVTERFQ